MKEAAKEVRSTLKLHGWNSRKVAVKCLSCGLDSEINVTIKDPKIPRCTIMKIVAPYQVVRQCPLTGDILLGGNLYVIVNYSQQASTSLYRDVLEKLQAADPGIAIILDHDLRVWRDANATDQYYRVRHTSWTTDRMFWGIESAAHNAAEIILGENLKDRR